MSISGNLLSFGLRYVFNVAAEQVTSTLEKRLTDHGGTLPAALARANDRAWEAVGLALAGDSWFERIKDIGRTGDVKGIRDQIKLFLDQTQTGLEAVAPNVRAKATEEWLRLRKAKKLTGTMPAAELASGAAALERYSDPMRLAEAAHRAVADTALALKAEAPHLAELLTAAPPGGTPLLVAAFAFFFRRELETNPELAAGLTFDSLRQLSHQNEKSFALLDSRTEGILDQLDMLFDALDRGFADTHGKIDDLRAKIDKLLDERDVTTNTRDPLKVSVTNEKELALLKQWREEMRKLPPEFLESADWSKLGDALAAGGRFGEAREAHTSAAQTASTHAAKAEAQFKAYRDACEDEKLWGDALAALVLAAEIDPARFAPFPLNRYEPVAILGVGGYGTVIRCKQRLAKGREVAVKTFHAADLGRDVNDVFAEAHTLSELPAAGFVKVIHWEYADASEARPYLVMEYFPGVSLTTNLKKHGRLSVADFITVAKQVAEAMVAAHASNILHRDLKPGNILVLRTGERWDVRVIDFGLAVRFAAVKVSISTSLPQRTRRDMSFAGTLEYASPEQKGSGHVDFRSDVYSFGKTMLEALLSTTELTTRAWQSVPEAHRGAIQELLERCIEKNPTDRHAGFGQVLTMLEAMAPRMPEAAKSPVVESRPPLRGTVFPATKPEVVDPLEKEKARRQREEEERIAEELRQRKELSKKITQEFELRKAEEKEKEGFRRIEAQAQREADAVEQRRKERDHRQADDEERRNAAEERDAAREAAQKARRAAWVRRLIIPSAIGLAVILVGVAFLYATRSRQEVQVSHQVDTKMSRAKSDMLTIKKAYEVYSMQHQGEWPGGPSDVYSLLKNGAKAFESPWGVHYMVEIQPVRQPNGTMIEQPVVFCQPPGMQEFRVPEAPKGP